MDGNQRWYHYKYAQNVFNVELLRGVERNEWELVDACFGYQINFDFPRDFPQRAAYDKIFFFGLVWHPKDP